MEIEDLLQENRVPFRRVGEHHHARAGWIQIDCPHCGDEGKFHLGINVSRLYSNCWRCGKVDLWSTLALVLKTTDRRLLKAISRRRVASEATDQPPARLVIPFPVQALLKPHKTYLRSRGFDPQTISRLWGVQGIAMAPGGWAWRLFIPFEHSGQIVNWTTRSTRDAGLRYRSATPAQVLVPRNRLLYGWDYVRQGVIVVEGPTDVWRVGPGAVGTLGLSVSATQIALLSKVPTRVICFDTEPQAQRRASALADALSVMPGTTYKVELDSADPGKATRKEIRRLRKLAELSD